MIFRSLKITLFQRILVVLMMALACVSVVICVLWYNESLRGLLARNFSILSSTQRQMTDLKAAEPSDESLTSMCKEVGPHCEHAFFLRDGRVTGLQGSSRIQSSRVADSEVGRRGYIFFFEQDSILGALQQRRAVQAVPVGVDGKARLGLMVRIPSLLETLRQHSQLIFAFILLNALIFSALILFRLIRVVIKPLERLVALANKYSGSFDFLLQSEHDENEIRQLSLALNTIFSRIESDKERLQQSYISLKEAQERLLSNQKEMIHAEKLASLGRISAGLAHEIGNPVGIIQGYIELLSQKDLSGDEREDFARRAEKELQRISRLIRNMLDYSRSESLAGAHDISVVETVQYAVEVVRTQKELKTVAIRVETSCEHDRVDMAREALYQVLLNCLLNAADSIAASSQAGVGEIFVCCRSMGHDANRIQIILRDNGTGVSVQHLENVFDPFFTTKGPGKGTGLGLSVSQSLVQAAHGTILLENNTTVGVTVTIELPLLMNGTDR